MHKTCEAVNASMEEPCLWVAIHQPSAQIVRGDSTETLSSGGRGEWPQESALYGLPVWLGATVRVAVGGVL